MSESISQLGKIPTPLNISAEKPSPSANQTQADASSSIKPRADEFVMSADAEKALSTAEFDTAMVARIKTAISEGNYPVNPEAVAEKFASLENMIYDK